MKDKILNRLPPIKYIDIEISISIIWNKSNFFFDAYNNEAELSAIVSLVYLSARDMYDIRREDKAGIGYVDFIFYPKYNQTADCIILELKVDKTPEEAIQQIKEKKYALAFKEKLGEEPKYTGRILAVGIGYFKETKKHKCVVEVLK